MQQKKGRAAAGHSEVQVEDLATNAQADAGLPNRGTTKLTRPR